MPLRPPQRVLMTADTVGGVWQYALGLCGALARAGVNVTLAAMGGEPSADQRSDAAQIPGLSLHTSTCRLEWMPGAAADVRQSGEWLLRIEQTVAPDVVHVNGLCHGALAWSAPVLVVAHSCVVSWWESVRGTPLPGEWQDYRRAAEGGLRRADAVLAPSRSMAAAVERLYGVRPVGVVPNGRDAGAGLSADGPKEPIVLGAGRLWDDAKNLSLLDSACAGLSWPLYLAGPVNGPFGTRLDPRHGVALGVLPAVELAAWMRRAAIYALPARYEPFGLSVLEAAFCGCALVLGDIPSLRENWEGAAWFVPPSSRAALRDAIRTLIASPARRAELGRRARARAAQFTVSRMAAGYLSVYAQLLDRSGAMVPADVPAGA